MITVSGMATPATTAVLMFARKMINIMAHRTILLTMSEMPPFTIEETILASSETQIISMPPGIFLLSSS